MGQRHQPEHRKMELYTNILRSFDRMGENADADFSLDYVRYIVDSCETAIIITGADSIITVPSELAGQKLEGKRLEEFSHNEPFHYNIWGMKMTLYYKESKMYTELRHVLDGFNRSFLDEITNNGVLVPVLVVDSLQGEVLASGNMQQREFGTPEALASRLCEMEEDLCWRCCCWCRTTCSAPPGAWSRTASGWVWPRRPPISWERPSRR